MKLLQLCMIVKNGADTIQECLESYKPFIDRWCILDTGSTDGTQRIIRNAMEGIPGKLHEHPFEGFSKSRNRCFKLARRKCRYNLMVDDSYVLKNGEALVRQLEELPETPIIAIEIHTETCKRNEINALIDGPKSKYVYTSKRITLSRADFKYHGDIHEDIPFVENVVLKDCYLFDCPRGSQISRTLDRKTSDLSLLTGKSDPRSVYYRAATLNALGRFGEAELAYKERVLLPDDDYEEKFVSLMALGDINAYKNDFNAATKYYLSAAMTYPNRCGEAYFFLFMYTEKEYWIYKAWEHRVPGTYRLVLEHSIYDYYIPFFYNFVRNGYK